MKKYPLTGRILLAMTAGILAAILLGNPRSGELIGFQGFEDLGIRGTGNITQGLGKHFGNVFI